MQVAQLIEVGEMYADHRGLKLSTLSTYAVNDGKWLPGLKGGAGCTIRKASAFLSWLSVNWPNELDWPDSLERPVPDKSPTSAA